jgi:hypothetical protein
LKKSFKQVKSSFELRNASILDMPFADGAFDLVWNEGVLEHFQPADYQKAISEMVRVTRKYILIDVPYAKSKPYVLSKKWLEQNGLWVWGYEDPKVSLKTVLADAGVRVIKEVPVGSIQTNKNYVNMIPIDKRQDVLSLLTEQDFSVFPHLMTIGEKIR